LYFDITHDLLIEDFGKRFEHQDNLEKENQG
jgi:hypothetical protein